MAKDVDLFGAAMVGTKPLKGRRRAATAVVSPIPPRKTAQGSDMPSSSSLPLRERLQAGSGRTAALAFDRDVDRALSRGKRAPEARLDLHGMTLTAAERAVSRFLVESTEQGRRVVLIVTGKGLRLEGGRVFGGRIRAEFAGWLERADNHARVAGVRTAHPRHGGSGAFYVLLRRRSAASSRSLRATPQR